MVDYSAVHTQKPMSHGSPAGSDHDRDVPEIDLAQMDQMPIVRKPVLGDVLAHGRHHDPVAESHTAECERAEYNWMVVSPTFRLMAASEELITFATSTVFSSASTSASICSDSKV